MKNKVYKEMTEEEKDLHQKGIESLDVDASFISAEQIEQLKKIDEEE